MRSQREPTGFGCIILLVFLAIATFVVTFSARFALGFFN